MLEFRLARATAAATFALLVIGGMVHATGSSLACPDWPLCYGQFFPAMEGGVLFEHGHRLVALVVSLLTLALAVTVWRRRKEAAVRVGAIVALGLVLFQASLGALTVVWKLPLVVSSGHLATSMAFFSVLVWLSWRLAPPGPSADGAAASGLVRAAAGAAALGVYVQIILGALVRHTGSSLACGTSVVLCEGVAWPIAGPAQLVTLHRFFGVAVAILVVGASVAAIRAGPARARRVASLAAPLVLVQIFLGAWTVWRLISVPVVSLHLAGGALLLADTLLLFLLLGPLPASQRAGSDRLPGLVPAAG